MLFEKISRRCLFTFDGGKKIQVILTMPKPTKPIFPEKMERHIMDEFNKSQPNAVHKVIKCHIMRN